MKRAIKCSYFSLPRGRASTLVIGKGKQPPKESRLVPAKIATVP